MTAPNIRMIEWTMRLFVSPGEIGEVRLLDGGSRGFFFRHEEIPQAAQLAAKHCGNVKGTYICMNPIKPETLGNRKTLQIVYDLTKNSDIASRKWFLIDCDPKSAERGRDDSATDDEKAPSFERREQVIQFLAELGFPEPYCFDSGNGAHAIYPIDLPNDPDSASLLQSLLDLLHKRFGTENCAVDTSVHNAARITKLYGTPARKGEDRPERPHRLSLVQSSPDGEAAEW